MIIEPPAPSNVRQKAGALDLSVFASRIRWLKRQSKPLMLLDLRVLKTHVHKVYFKI